MKLFDYPCLHKGAVDKCYKGHASFVANVCFSFDDRYILTAGGDDKCVFVWGTDIAEETRRRAALMSTEHAVETDDVDAESVSVHKLGGEGGHDDIHKDFKPPTKKQEAAVNLVPTGGDEFGAIKPWKSAIRAPTDWKDPVGETLGEAPAASLELKFVYGYRGWDCRSNIGFGDTSTSIIYHIAAVGIMYNSQTHTQVHNVEHDDDILCLAVHPDGHLVATGEIGPKPKIVLWDATSGTTVRVIMYHTKGVSNIAFSSDGKLLVSIGMDQDRIIAVHNVASGNCVGNSKAGKGIDVYGIATGCNNTFVTVGKDHIKFGDLPVGNAVSGELPSKSGVYNKAVKARTVTSACYLKISADVITGMSDGGLLLWKDKSNSKFVVDAHKGPITALCVVADNNSAAKGNNLVAGASGNNSSSLFISGGNDGFIHIWDGNQLIKTWTCNLNTSTPSSILAQISALSSIENKVVIGTKGGEIFEVDRVSNDLLQLVQGHCGNSTELWGLSPVFDANRNNNRFVTVCEDQYVRIWDGNSRRCLDKTKVQSKARAITTTFTGTQIAVGCMDGRVIVLSTNDLSSQQANLLVAKGWIQCMSYSIDSTLLAVGSHDDNIYVLDTKTYSTKAICKGHHSYITAVDFTLDSKTLQTTSGDYELLFWETNTGKSIKSASSLQDALWATWTLPFGWPVQGIFPPNSDGTDINSVSRSSLYDASVVSSCGKSAPSSTYNKNCLLVTGDDFKRVKLFKYPATKEGAKFKEFKGHSEHVSNVKFSNDDNFVYSTGGLDKAILQFEIKFPKAK